jgi:hypothetical protein
MKNSKSERSNTMDEEELKWALFRRCKEKLFLTEDELMELEIAREKAWSETRKKYGL